MVALLGEIEARSPYTSGDATRGGLTLLFARLAHVATGARGKPRSISAMKQAWWRWTTSGPHASTPPALELARIAQYARERRWLQSPPSRLEERLSTELNAVAAEERRVLESYWSPAIRVAVDDLFEFLEAQISGLDANGVGHAGGEAEQADEAFDVMPATLSPPADFVQKQVETMVGGFVERILITLSTSRGVFADPQEGDEYVQLYRNWPVALRRMASSLSGLLNDAAREIEQLEVDSVDSVEVAASSSAKRAELFPRASTDPEPWEPL